MYSDVLLQCYARRNTGNTTGEGALMAADLNGCFSSLSTNEDISSLISIPDLTRFNKIAIQDKGPDEKWTRKPLAYRELNIVHICVTCPPEICVNLVFKHIHAASSYTICR